MFMIHVSITQRSYSRELFEDCTKILLKNSITPKVRTILDMTVYIMV